MLKDFPSSSEVGYNMTIPPCQATSCPSEVDWVHLQHNRCQNIDPQANPKAKMPYENQLEIPSKWHIQIINNMGYTYNIYIYNIYISIFHKVWVQPSPTRLRTGDLTINKVYINFSSSLHCSLKLLGEGNQWPLNQPSVRRCFMFQCKK